LRRSRGTRVSGLLVVHVALPDPPATDQPAAQVGFVVSRAVGPAVARNLVRRRLRHLVAHRLDRLPAGSRVVVRALPDSADASWSSLDMALDRALGTAVRRAVAAPAPVGEVPA